MLQMYSGLANSIETAITAPISATDTEIKVNDTANIPMPPNLLVIGGALPGAETVKLLAIIGKTLMVERGFQGIAKAWSAGAPIARNFTEYDYRAMITNIAEVNENEISHTESGVAPGVHGLRLNGKSLEFFDAADNVWRSVGMNTSNFNYTVSNANNIAALAWTAKATPDAETINGSCVSVGTDVYLLGNASSFRKYNTLTNAYTALAACSVTVSGIVYTANAGTRLAVIGSDIYAFGLGGSAVFVAKYNITGNSWSLVAPLPQSGQFASSAYLNGFLYLLGTGTKCWKYEVSSKIWTAIADCPVNANYSKVVAYGNSVYLFGGATAPYMKIYRYDTVLNVWEEVFTCAYSFQYASVTLVGSKVYIFGSGTNTGVYDIAGNTFTTLSGAPNNLSYSSAAYDSGNLIYVVGSSDSAFNQLNAFNITTKVWQAAKAVCPVDGRYSSVAYHDGSLYAMVGANMYRYSVSSNAWSLVSAVGVNLAYASATAVNGKLFYLGGNVTPYTHMLAYDPASNLWSPYGHGIGVFPNTVLDTYESTVYHVGMGTSPNFIFEKYDPIASEWSQLTDAPLTGFKAAGRVMSGNLVLASGSKTALYSIADNTWHTAPDCPQDVTGYPSVRLSDSTMLIAKDSVLLLYNAVLNIWLVKVTSAATAVNDSSLAFVGGALYSFFRSASVYNAKMTVPPDEGLLYYTISPVAASDEVYADCGLAAVGIATTNGQAMPLRQKTAIQKDADLIVALTSTSSVTTYVQGYIKR